MKLFFIFLAVTIFMIDRDICVDARQNHNYANTLNLTYYGQNPGHYSHIQRTNGTRYSTNNSRYNYNQNEHNKHYKNDHAGRPGATPSYTTNTHTQIVPTNTHFSYQTPRPEVGTQQPAYYPTSGGYNYNNNGYPRATPTYKPNTYTNTAPTNYYPSYQTARPTVGTQHHRHYPTSGSYTNNGYNNYNNNGYPHVTPTYTPNTQSKIQPTNNYPSYQTPRPTSMTQQPVYYPAPELKQMPAVLYLPGGESGYYKCHNHGQQVTPFAYPAGYTGQPIFNNNHHQPYSSYPVYGQFGITGGYVQTIPTSYPQSHGKGTQKQSAQNSPPPPYVIGLHGQPCTFIFY